MHYATECGRDPNIVASHGLLSSACLFWHYRLWIFQVGATKLERFLPKNQHTNKQNH